MTKTRAVKILQAKFYWPRRWAERVLRFAAVDLTSLTNETDLVENVSIMAAHDVLADMEAI